VRSIRKVVCIASTANLRIAESRRFIEAGESPLLSNSLRKACTVALLKPERGSTRIGRYDERHARKAIESRSWAASCS